MFPCVRCATVAVTSVRLAWQRMWLQAPCVVTTPQQQGIVGYPPSGRSKNSLAWTGKEEGWKEYIVDLLIVTELDYGLE